MKNILAFCLIIFIFSSQANAQPVMHSAGVTISLLTGNKTPGFENNSDFFLQQNNLTYFPRFNFIEKENSSFSIGAPVGVGFGLVRNVYVEDVGFAFSYDLPVVADYNIGCRSTSENNKGFGGYIGGGYGYSRVNVSGSLYSDFTGESYGPIFRGGIRFGSSGRSFFDRGGTIGLYYKKGMEDAKLSTYGLNIFLDF